jgi:hypothetical protein
LTCCCILKPLVAVWSLSSYRSFPSNCAPLIDSNVCLLKMKIIIWSVQHSRLSRMVCYVFQHRCESTWFWPAKIFIDPRIFFQFHDGRSNNPVCSEQRLQYRYTLENWSSRVLSKIIKTRKIGMFSIQNLIFKIWEKTKNRVIFTVYQSILASFYLNPIFEWKMINLVVFFCFFQNYAIFLKLNQEPTKPVQTDFIGFHKKINWFSSKL